MRISKLTPAFLSLTLLPALGCTELSSAPPAAAPEAAAPGVVTPATPRDLTLVPSAQDDAKHFVAHEWGTFTSVASSTGESLPGMHHTDEFLPAFVYGRDGEAINQKSLELIPTMVTQKLETPVVYFYSDRELKVSLEVDFPKGVISEWYPNAHSYLPRLGELFVIEQGHMRWDAEVIPGALPVEPVPPEDIWAPSREVPDAASVRIGGENERFIFYRGLGSFEMPLKVRAAPAPERVEIINGAGETVPAAIFLRVEGDRVGFTRLDTLGGGETRFVELPELLPTPKEMPPLEYLAQVVSDVLADDLVATGLYRDEARAMVDTWRRSYFQTPGLRILYIVPREWTDALLPLRMTPTPKELVRTLVGRIEVLTREEEMRVVEQVQRWAPTGNTAFLQDLGRFAEPKLRRAMQLIAHDDESKEFCAALIEAASTQP